MCRIWHHCSLQQRGLTIHLEHLTKKSLVFYHVLVKWLWAFLWATQTYCTWYFISLVLSGEVACHICLFICWLIYIVDYQGYHSSYYVRSLCIVFYASEVYPLIISHRKYISFQVFAKCFNIFVEMLCQHCHQSVYMFRTTILEHGVRSGIVYNIKLITNSINSLTPKNSHQADS